MCQLNAHRNIGLAIHCPGSDCDYEFGTVGTRIATTDMVAMGTGFDPESYFHLRSGA